MMSRFAAALALVLCLSAATAAIAAEVPAPGPWKFEARTALTLTQSSFSSHWKGGDKGSLVWVVGVDVAAERQFSKSYNMKNTLHSAYGQTLQQVVDPSGGNRLVWDAPDKTTDMLEFESNSRWSLNTWMDPYFAVGAETQYSDQSDPIAPISFNPVKLKETAGLARVIEKTEDAETITRLGFGLRETFGRAWTDPVLRTQDSFITRDGGVEWQTTVTKPLLEKKVLYKGKLLLFAPVFFSKTEDLKAMDENVRAYVEGAGGTYESVQDYWRAPDLDWQNAFSTQITKLISVNLFIELLYDKFDTAANIDSTMPPDKALAELQKNTRKVGQYKQTLALALTYRLY
jgi:hypothetical protein